MTGGPNPIIDLPQSIIRQDSPVTTSPYRHICQDHYSLVAEVAINFSHVMSATVQTIINLVKKTYSTTATGTEHKSEVKLTKDATYLALTGKLCGVLSENLGRKFTM